MVQTQPSPGTSVKLPGAVSGNTSGQGGLVRVGAGAVGIDQVHLAAGGIPGQRLAGPLVFPGGVVEHQVDAQRDAPPVQLRGERLQVGHAAQPRIHRAVVRHGIAAVTVAVPGLQQRHQMQVRDPEFVRSPDAPRRRAASRRTGPRNRHSRSSGTAGTRPDRSHGAGPAAAAGRAAGRRVQRVEDQVGREPGGVDHAAVDLLERPGDVERQLVQPGQERVGVPDAEPLPHRVLRLVVQPEHAIPPRARPVDDRQYVLAHALTSSDT